MARNRHSWLHNVAPLPPTAGAHFKLFLPCLEMPGLDQKTIDLPLRHGECEIFQLGHEEKSGNPSKPQPATRMRLHGPTPSGVHHVDKGWCSRRKLLLVQVYTMHLSAHFTAMYERTESCLG